MKTLNRTIALFLCTCLILVSIPMFTTNVTAAEANWLWPVPSCTWIKQEYKGVNIHNGIDIPGDYGAEIIASKSGTVAVVYSGCKNHNAASTRVGCDAYGCTPMANSSPAHFSPMRFEANGESYTLNICNFGFGNGIIIDHHDGTFSHYAHLSSSSVVVGQAVVQGQTIGYIGNAGAAFGSHLHFSLATSTSAWTTYNNNPIDRDSNGVYYIYQKEDPVVLDDDFYAYIVLQKDWKCLASVNNNVQLADSNAAIPNQIWHFIKQLDGSYKIINEFNGYCLNVDEAGRTNGTNINVWKDNGEAAERWRIYCTSDYYYLKPGHCDLVMDCDNAYSTPGTNIQLYTYNGSAAQRFSIYYLSNDGIAYQKPSRPAASSVITASAPAGEQSVISWTASPEVNQFDRRSYDLHIYNESGALILTDTGLTETDYTYAFPNKGRYFVEVVSVNTLYADWYTISEKAAITVEDPCAHNYSYSLVSEPSLSTEGQLLGVCSLCDKSYTIILPRLNSTDYTYKETGMPTCQETGIGSYTWNNSDYGEYSFEIELSKLPHTYVSQAVARTCTDYAHILYTCSVCGDTYKEYLEGEYSEWSTDYPTGIDESLIESKKEYRYSDYETKQSNEPSLSGWTQIDSKWQLSRTGDLSYVQQWPATFYTGHALYSTYNITPYYPLETATEKIVVNSSAITGYLYWHYCRNSYANGPIDRLISDEYTDTYYAFHAFYSTTSPRDLSGLSSGCYIYSNAACCTDTYWYFPVAVTTQNYSMYQKIFTYGRWGEWSEWSTTAYQENSTRKVEERTLYRYIVPLDGEHLWDNGVITLAPTETETGLKTFTCTRCGETRTEIIPKTDHIHNYVDIITEPTCTEQGYTTHTCSGCGDTYVDTYVPARGHNFSLWTQTTAPTCTEQGEEKRTCSRCNAFETREIAALGHNYQTVVTAPTCTADGYTTYTCSRCGDSYVADEVAALGHTPGAVVEENRVDPTCTTNGSFDTVTYCLSCGAELTHVHTDIAALEHNWDDGVIDPAATCTTYGIKTFTCRRCGEKKTETIVAAGHTPGESAMENEVAATCTTAGSYDMVIRCTTCNEILYTEYYESAALGHDWNDGEVTTPATVTTDGVKTFTCKRCGATKTEAIPATGEDACKHENAHPEHKDATCVETGYNWMICDKCGVVISEEILPALGHDLVADEAVAATCMESGLTAGEHCTRCDYKVAQTVIPAIDHKWDEGKVTTAPTATKEGIKTFTCTICGANKTETIPATGEKEPCDGGANCPSYRFKDVKAGDWYHEAVDFAVKNGLFNGMSDTTFEPNTPMTRGMLVTVMWRYEGQPEGGTNNFVDVKDGEWYTKAVAWAAENGIVTGVGDNKFDPNGKITREQMAAILFRYSDYKGYDVSKRDNFAGFTDKAKVSSWAKDAYGWAVAEKLIGGNVINGKTLLDPQGNATRAQVATILMRFINKIA